MTVDVLHFFYFVGERCEVVPEKNSESVLHWPMPQENVHLRSEPFYSKELCAQ